jgi:penicillin-binding protein 1A
MRRLRHTLACLTVLATAADACTYESRAVLPVVPIESESSTLYAADGRLITTFHAEENRKVVHLEEIPAHVRDAVIAIEDERFYRHNGVDVRGVLRALRANTGAGQVQQGGSTITQQYVKKVLLRDDSQTVSRKLQEASMAVQLERRYSKDRILELYLNAIYFGNGAYGLEAAARQYFGKSVETLTLAEGALLAGLIQRPSATDPYKGPDAALARRNVVLERMRFNGFATDAAIDAALVEPLTLASATTPAAERYAAPYFVEAVKQWILDDPRFGSTPQDRRDLLFGGGLRIQTTVDLDAQAQAEAAANGVLPDPNGPAVSLVSIEPATGYVKAMVGGRDFFGTGPNDKLNLATQGGRSAGSSFKPFTLATALEEGIDPQTQIPAPGCINIPLPHEVWDVCNAEGTGPAVTSILEGTVHSYNTLYAQLILRVGPEKAMEMATRLGIRSPLQSNPASVLGTNNVTALDMASAYASFANRGVYVPPVLVTRIARADGTVLYEYEHTQKKVLAANVADTVTSILEQVIQRGTGTRAKLDRPAAGKTGSSQKNRDGWFVGYTPDLATAVWVGFPNVGANGELVSMRPPRTPITVFGGTYPAQIWQRFMSAALAGRPPTPFHPPDSTTPTTVGATSNAPTTTTTIAAASTPVPQVVGMKVEDASAALTAAGFAVERIPAPAGAKPPGRVVAQSPIGGTSAPAGSTVRIEVAGDPSG